MRILFVKVMLPLVLLSALIEPFIGVLFFILISFVRLEVLTWGMVDARFALYTSAFTLCGWLINLSNPKQIADRIPIQYWLFVFVVFGIWLSTWQAVASVAASQVAAEKFLKYALFLFLMVQMITSEVRLRLVQETMFWGINFLVIWGFQQHFVGNARLERVGGGDFADSSALAALFLIVFPGVVYRVYHTNRWVRWSGIAFAPFYLIDLTFTQSRSGFLGAVAALALIFLRAKNKLRYIMAAIPIGIALLFVMPDSFLVRLSTLNVEQSEMEKLHQSAQEAADRRSSDQRLKVWPVAWAVFKDYPVFGVGRANFGLIHAGYAAPIWYGKIDEDLYADLFLQYRVAHNMYLDLLMSNGVFTFVPWCLLMLSVPLTLRRARRHLGKAPMDQYWRFQSYAIEIGLLAYLITGIFQDLAELEIFYWVVILGGITGTVIEKRARERLDTARAEGRLPEAVSIPQREEVPLIPGAVYPSGHGGTSSNAP